MKPLTLLEGLLVVASSDPAGARHMALRMAQGHPTPAAGLSWNPDAVDAICQVWASSRRPNAHKGASHQQESR